MHFNMAGKLKRFVISFFISLLIIFVFIGVFSLILPHLSSADTVSFYIKGALRFVFCFLCAFLYSKSASSRGFLIGGVVGLILFVFTLFSLILNGETLGVLAIIKELALYLIIGMAGGITGINI